MGEASRDIRKELWNLPNILTMGRIFAIPFVVLGILMSEYRPGIPGGSVAYDLGESELYCWLSMGLFALAAITDYLDGYLARRWNMITLIGKFLDPVADKLLVLATLVALVQLGRVDAWIVILILMREVSINSLRTLAISEGLTVNVIKAGKFKTAFQMFGIGALIVHYEYPVPLLAGLDPADFNLLGNAFILISLAFSVVSAVSYFRSFIRAIEAKYQSETPEGT
ncbi:MAG: CDP-diacylglycerol--glycerol-3-phosphate 3-phosphatidyltransferase [Pseudomonadota bacterium]